MRIAVLGTGVAGRTLAGKLVAIGHSVTMGSRSATNEAATRWAAGAGPQAKAATFADAAADGEVVINATPGAVSLEVLQRAPGTCKARCLLTSPIRWTIRLASRRRSP